MPRRRSYDPDQVRRATVAAFLETGFEATSLADLEAATGLDRRQIYDGFGDKRAVFLQALVDFQEMAGAEFLRPMEENPEGVKSIAASLHGMIDVMETPRGRLGCLICNTAREPIAADSDVRAQVDAFFRRIERAYERALQAAIAAGEIPSRDPAAELARFFLAIHISLCVMSRAGESESTARSVADQALARLR